MPAVLGDGLLRGEDLAPPQTGLTKCHAVLGGPAVPMMDYQCVVVYTIVSIATPEEDVETISQRNGCLGCVTGLVKKLSIVTSVGEVVGGSKWEELGT